MKKIIAILLALLLMVLVALNLSGCSTQAQRVSYNLSQEADSVDTID